VSSWRGSERAGGKVTLPRPVPELAERVAQLSPAKRALLEQFLLDRTKKQHRPADQPARRQGEPFPLSFSQRRMWFFSQWAPDCPLYGLRVALRCEGVLDIVAFRSALRAVAARHEILRTTFTEIDWCPVQVIAPEARWPMTVVDLTSLPLAARDTAVRELLDAEVGCGFDLARGPLVRARLVLLRSDEVLLMLSIHHIVADGWSYALLARELSACYYAIRSHQQPVLPELSVQYVDYAARQQREFSHDDLRPQLEWWRTYLAGSPPLLSLPTDRPRPTVASYRAGRAEARIPYSVAQELKELSRRTGTTLFMTLLAAFQVLVHRYSGQTDIVVGSPIAGRTSSDVENTIGCFINTLALRNDLSGDPVFLDLLEMVRKNSLAAYSHQEVPFDLLVKELRIGRGTSHTPVFQLLFGLRNTPEPQWELSGVSVHPIAMSSPGVHFDLSVEVIDEPDGLAVTLDYSTDLYERATATRVLDCYSRLLAGISLSPHLHIGDLPIYPPEEEMQTG
jgi:hypothetical protein